ncbi:MAG: WS/DGAT domain-containing protein, partial [Actinomycetes bacterium]
LHALGSRLGSDLGTRVYDLVITNVPGPQFPLYVGGSLMLASYPVVPLAKGQPVAIGLTSYNGGVYFGINADRDAMPDVDVLAQCLLDATEELKDVSRPSRRSMGRRPKPPIPDLRARASERTATTATTSEPKNGTARPPTRASEPENG